MLDDSEDIWYKWSIEYCVRFWIGKGVSKKLVYKR